MTAFRCFGDALPFPLAIEGDWVRIQCGVNGDPNYIFGRKGIEEFYNAGTGIYTRENGKPSQSLQYWIDWYEKEKTERIQSYATIQEIKALVRSMPADRMGEIAKKWDG
jgi:hypothetical protein